MARNTYFDEYFESPTYLDGRPFKAYAATIKRVIFEHPEGITIRAIHLGLGTEARPEWTADALEAICGIEPFGVAPTRYRPAALRRQPQELGYNRSR